MWESSVKLSADNANSADGCQSLGAWSRSSEEQNDVAADRAPRSRFSRLPLDRFSLAHRRRSIARSPQMGIQERDSLNVANLLLVADHGAPGIAGRFRGANSNHHWYYVARDFWI